MDATHDATWLTKSARLLRATTWRSALVNDRGSVSAELVLVTPLLLLLLLLIVQFALWSHASHVAQAAASSGLAAARAHDGSAASGSAAAQRMLDDLADGPLDTPRVTAHRDTTSAVVQVDGVASTVVPFLRLPVHAEAAGPVERFVQSLDASR
ncbi:TadE/TadG family type IV pilus assembly protein [Actinokineospora sp. HUAS TT18]|uniref:TadE/TadG family type IV pilus assembly protein n=1 Tax=Actinokineospora sp. HUAS TT18 TaxID=3447451 RepID=UPI003F51CFB7